MDVVRVGGLNDLPRIDDLRHRKHAEDNQVYNRDPRDDHTSYQSAVKRSHRRDGIS